MAFVNESILDILTAQGPNEPVIFSNGSVILAGSLEVTVVGVNQLNFSSSGQAEIILLVSSTNISGSFQTISLNVSGSLCYEYSSSPVYQKNLFGLLLTRTSTNKCDDTSFPSWKIAVICVCCVVAVTLAGIIAARVYTRKHSPIRWDSKGNLTSSVKLRKQSI